MHALMAKKQTDVNSTTQQQFKAIMSGEKKDKLWWWSAVMMCRYSAVSRELLASITRESCLPVSGSTVKVGGRWRRALWSIYEQDIHHENIAIFLVSFFLLDVFLLTLAHNNPPPPESDPRTGDGCGKSRFFPSLWGKKTEVCFKPCQYQKMVDKYTSI